jgi:hypothetical protein
VTQQTESDFLRIRSRRLRGVHTILVFALVAILVASLAVALPPHEGPPTPGVSSGVKGSPGPPTPPPQFGCVGYGASLLVISPAPAAGIAGAVFELEGSGYYNRTSGNLGNFTIWMANFTGGSLLYLTFIPAGVPIHFFVNVTVPSANATTPFSPGSYEFWSVENYTTNSTCANYPFTIAGVPPPSIGCLSWTASLNVTSPSPARGVTGSPVTLQGRGFSFVGNTLIYWSAPAGSPFEEVTTAAASSPNGWFNTTFDVPTGYAAGTYVFWATDGDSDCAGAQFNLTGGPTLALTPNTGPGATNVTVTGTGFNGSDTSVSITGKVLLFPLSCALSGGSITGSCYFLVSGGVAGPHPITGVGNVVGGPIDTASATFTLFPTIILNPATGSADSSFSISGIDFSPGPAAAFVTFDGQLLTPTGGSDCAGGSSATLITPDDLGQFVCKFTVPTWATGGPNSVQGDDTNTSELTPLETFTVTGLPHVTITSTPTTGPVGTPVTVTGSGWIPGDYILLGAGPVGDDYVTGELYCSGTSGGEATANLTGGFTCAFDFPAVVPGVYSVLATDASEVTTPVTIVYSTNTFTVTPELTITSTPTTGPVGTPVTVDGSGWTPGDSVSLGVGPVGPLQSIPAVTGGVSVNATGGFAFSFTIPTVVAGEYWALAFDSTQNPQGGPGTIVNSTNTFTVTPALMITSTPTTGPVGTPVTVAGTGWPAGETIGQVVFGVSLLGISVRIGCSGGNLGVDAFGDWSCSFSVPPIRPGTYSAIAVTTAGLQFSDNTFTVSGLTITSSPTTGPVGTPVTVSGTGWIPGDTVALGFGPVGTLGSILAGTGGATVNATGVFTASVTIPPVGAGTYWALAYDSTQNSKAGPETIANSTNTFTVTAPPPTGGSARLFGVPVLDLELLGGAVGLVAIGAAAVVLGRRGKAPSAP